MVRPPSLGGDVAIERASLWAVFRQGVITNVLNPKVALFFLAFLPQFIDPSRGNPAVQTAALGLMFDVQGTLVNIAVALGASSLGTWLRTRGQRSGRVLGRATGVVFIGLGARLAVKRG
ncbi:MAG: LysE family translocator [Gemmatimonadota bacterium]|nr:LysE family translocator [Gemmatimonadota bacterium]